MPTAFYVRDLELDFPEYEHESRKSLNFPKILFLLLRIKIKTTDAMTLEPTPEGKVVFQAIKSGKSILPWKGDGM